MGYIGVMEKKMETTTMGLYKGHSSRYINLHMPELFLRAGVRVHSLRVVGFRV